MTNAQATLDGFVDDVDAGPPAVVVDRSTAENYVDCPHAAVMKERKLVSTSSELTDIGDEAHRIIGQAVRIRATEGITPHDMRALIESEAMKSRPDIQPRVLMALRRAYPIVGLICYQSGEGGNERNPDDLLRYDGGEGARAGQLAWDILPADGDRGPVRITGELDLLVSTPSIEELEVWDWKSGWRWWTATEIEASFQFGFYALLVFLNYPNVQRVRVRVFMTAYGEAASAVEFTRGRDFWPIYERVKSAVGVYLKHYRTADVGDVPAWPQPARCALCPAARFCKLVHKPAARLVDDPDAFFDQLVALNAAVDQMEDQASTAVRQRGADFTFEGGGYGTDAPKQTRATPCKLYTIKTPKRDFGKAPEPAAV